MKRILIADDDPGMRLLLTETLTDAGYHILLAKTGTETIHKILNEPLDLVILDVKMPGAHGFEVLKKVSKIKKDLPIIMCTAYRHLKEDLVMNDLKISAYIVKPVDIDNLKAVVKETLEANEKE